MPKTFKQQKLGFGAQMDFTAVIPVAVAAAGDEREVAIKPNEVQPTIAKKQKKSFVDNNVENGNFRGLLINWHTVSYPKCTFSTTGFLNKRCITTSSIEIDYFDGRDRFVLTFSGSVYRLAENDELL
jgi:hypothetical protein